MSDRKAIIGWPSASSYFSFDSGTGSFSADYPLSQLSVLPLSRVARTTNLDASSTKFAATVTSSKSIGMVALVGHNLSIAAQGRVEIFADSALTTLIYDTGMADVWPTVFPFGELPWEAPNWWGGKYLANDLAGTTWTWIVVLPGNFLAQGIRVSFSDQTNGDGYVQAGFLEIAAQFEATYSFSWGAGYGYRFRTASTEAPRSGTKFFDERRKPRVFDGSFTTTRNEAMASFYEMVRQLDLVRPVIWLPRPDETVHQLRTAGLFRFIDPGTLATYSQFGLDQVPFKLEEVIG